MILLRLRVSPVYLLDFGVSLSPRLSVRFTVAEEGNGVWTDRLQPHFPTSTVLVSGTPPRGTQDDCRDVCQDW